MDNIERSELGDWLLLMEVKIRILSKEILWESYYLIGTNELSERT